MTPGSGRHPGAILSTALSIAFAFVLWLVALGRHTFDLEVQVPVQPPALPDTLVAIESSLPESITVHLTSTGTAMLGDQIRGGPAWVSLPVVPADLAGPFPAKTVHRLEITDLRWNGRPFDALETCTFEPAQLFLEIDRSRTASIPVGVVSAGPVPSRYFWTRCDPGSIQVSGAASVVDMLDSVRTAPVPPGEPAGAAGLEPLASVTSFTPPSVRAWLTNPVAVVSFDDLGISAQLDTPE